METNQNLETDSLDSEKPETNFPNFHNKENSSDDNTIWHNENRTMENNKNAKTEQSSNHIKDQGNQYKHFF